MSDEDVKQLAQMLIFEFSQQAVARGGQAIFSDINIYWEYQSICNSALRSVPAENSRAGPTVNTRKKASDLPGNSSRSLRKGTRRKALLLSETNRPYYGEIFPYTRATWISSIISADVASDKGNTYFVFDRGENGQDIGVLPPELQTRRIRLLDAREPWRMRYCALQKRLPQPFRGSVILAKDDDTKLFNLLTERFVLAVKAHKEKRSFLERLLALAKTVLFPLLTMNRDGMPYLRSTSPLTSSAWSVLTNSCRSIQGSRSTIEKAKFGLKVMAHLNLLSEKMKRQEGMKIVLEQTPAESTSYRLPALISGIFSAQGGL